MSTLYTADSSLQRHSVNTFEKPRGVLSQGYVLARGYGLGKEELVGFRKKKYVGNITRGTLWLLAMALIHMQSQGNVGQWRPNGVDKHAKNKYVSW